MNKNVPELARDFRTLRLARNRADYMIGVEFDADAIEAVESARKILETVRGI